MTAFYHVTDRRTGNARFLLADLLFGVGKSQRTTATNVFCRSVAGRDGCCDLQAALICPRPHWTAGGICGTNRLKLPAHPLQFRFLEATSCFA
jgi:hypothetical protein